MKKIANKSYDIIATLRVKNGKNNLTKYFAPDNMIDENHCIEYIKKLYPNHDIINIINIVEVDPETHII